MQSNGYTQVNHAFGKPSIKNDFTDKFSAKTLPMIVATTDQEGISGKFNLNWWIYSGLILNDVLLWSNNAMYNIFWMSFKSDSLERSVEII